MSETLFSVGSQSVSASDVLAYMKVIGTYAHAKRTVVMNEVIREHALHAGISINDETLQVYSDLRRIELGLHSSDDFQIFLGKIGIDLDTWEKTLENELLRNAVRETFGSNIFLVDAWKLIKGIPEIRNSITEALIAKGKEKGLNVSSDELQSASDIIRRAVGMHSAEEFRSVLTALRMDDNDWERYLHSNLSIAGLDPEEQYDLFYSELRAAIDKYPVINGLINDIIFGQIIHARAKKLKMTISDEEVETYINNFRRMFKLYSVKVFNLWLAASGYHLDQFIYIVQTELLKRKMVEQGIPEFDHTFIDKGIKASAYFVNALNSVKNFTALTEIARKKDFNLTHDDINKESEYLRRAKRLHKATDFETFLKEHDLSVDQWSWYCECSGLIRKLFAFETSDDKLIKFINKNIDIKNYVKNSLFNEVAVSARDEVSVN